MKLKDGSIVPVKPDLDGKVLGEDAVDKEICQRIFGTEKVTKKQYSEFLELASVVDKLTEKRIRKQFE